VSALFQFAITGAFGWVIYFPVRTLELAPLAVTTAVIGGGAVGLVGFTLGGRLCDVWGRRTTFAVSGVVYAFAAAAFFSVTADAAPSPVPWLGAAFAAMSVAGNAATVPLRASGTELFPTRLRGTFLGWAAIGAATALVAVNFAVGALALWLGGIAPAATVAGFVMLAAVAVFLAFLPETSGLELEDAALEEPADEG
jgi:MFS family permease